MSELKRCPFCGGEYIMETYFNWSPAIKCGDCGAVMTIPMEFGINKEAELKRKWNTRKPMERIVERLEQKIHRLHDIHHNVAIKEAIEIVKEEGGLNE